MLRPDVSDIFEDCIQAIERGTATIADCVARYPQVDDLEKILRAMQAARHLPQGHMSVATKKSLERRLTASMRQPKSPHRFPLTFAATMSAIGTVILLIVLATTRGLPSSQEAGLPVAGPSPTTLPLSETPTLSATSNGDFAVSMALYGVISSITPNAIGASLVVLEDGTTIQFNPPLGTDKRLVLGRALIVIVEINDNNQFVAQRITASIVVTSIPTVVPTDEAAVRMTPLPTPSAACARSSPPVAGRLAASFNVPPDEIMSWFCKGYGFGEIAKAYLLAQKSGEYTVAEIFALREAKQGWGQIAKKVGVSPGDLAHPLDGGGNNGTQKPGKKP